MIVIYLGKENAKVLKIIESVKVSYKRIGDTDLERNLAACFETQTSAKGRKKNAYICADDQDEAFKVMKELKEKGYSNVRISVLTEMSKTWTVQAWMEEMDQEFQFFSLRSVLKKEIEAAEKRKKTTFEQIVMIEKARNIFINGDSQIADYENIIKELKGMK